MEELEDYVLGLSKRVLVMTILCITVTLVMSLWTCFYLYTSNQNHSKINHELIETIDELSDKHNMLVEIVTDRKIPTEDY